MCDLRGTAASMFMSALATTDGTAKLYGTVKRCGTAKRCDVAKRRGTAKRATHDEAVPADPPVDRDGLGTLIVPTIDTV